MTTSLTTSLAQLELQPEEIKTYLHLLDVGPHTAGQLAQQLGIKRPSIYGFLAQLQEKGLATESKNIQGTKVFQAASPETIRFLFQQKIESLKKQEETYNSFLPFLLDKKASHSNQPQFQLFHGQAGVQHVLKDGLLYPNQETISYWPIEDMIDILQPEFLHYLNKERIKENIAVKTIWPHNQTIELANHPYMAVGEPFLREVRRAPKGIDFSMGYWIYAHRVAFVSSRKESFGFIIESRELVEMLTSQWQTLWNLSTPIAPSHHAAKTFLRDLTS